MAKGLGLPSIETATSLSLGARKRNVTLLSAWTSGEISGGGAVWARPAIDASNKAKKRKAVRFMVPRCAAPLGAALRNGNCDERCSTKRGRLCASWSLVVLHLSSQFPFLRAAPRDNTTYRASSHGVREWKRRPSAIHSSVPAWAPVSEREPSFRTHPRGSHPPRPPPLPPLPP